jgi:glyoxylase-like metal-dependent hydrolase (beta-lactamase superfamily II)
LGANCHLLHQTDSDEIIIVDPGDDAPIILETVGRIGGRVVAIWNTHAHIDHVNANAAVAAATGAPISIHSAEADWLGSPLKTLAAWAGVPFHPSRATHLWQDGQELDALGTQWRVLHTPGHSPGLCCLMAAGAGLVIAGDLVFRGSIGRTDLPGGDPGAMEESLRRFFGGWAPDSATILCGHGGATTVAQERRTNPFVREALAGAR